MASLLNARGPHRTDSTAYATNLNRPVNYQPCKPDSVSAGYGFATGYGGFMGQSKKFGLVAVSLAAVVPVILFAAANTTSQLAGSKVDNFMLADQTGMGHELYYYADR